LTNSFDVIVIGAGFAGPVAAKLCADAGLKTLILERSENIGDKIVSGLTIPFYGFLFGPNFIRDGNPPFERPADGIINYIIKDIDKKDIYIDETLKIPKPFSPIIAFGYNMYCKPFCQWEVNKALEAGVELRTSTTVIDFIKEKEKIVGLITDKEEGIKSKVIIDAEGSQGILAVKAGIRKKYPPEAISLADVYDYEMPKSKIDEIFGHSVKMCWGWDEQKIAPPLGHGNGLMVWPYRNSIHFMQDQCLRLDGNRVPNLKKQFDGYHEKITEKLPWWKEKVFPLIKMRARLCQCFEIYVGLDKKLRNMSNYTDGMILIGDAAGLESTELCDGVPAAWISAEIAAEVVIEAFKEKNYSKEFLKRYDERIKAHPLIEWSISGENRYNLRFAQEKHDLKLLKKYIHNGWGLGALTHFTTPLIKTVVSILSKDRTALSRWVKMYFRYYQNWHYENFDYNNKSFHQFKSSKKLRFYQFLFKASLFSLDSVLEFAFRLHKVYKWLLIPLINSLNKALSSIFPIFELFYLLMLRIIEPWADKYNKKLIKFVKLSNSSLYR
jgi:electron transfer flavoprotein-quinone oxidoreductase